jgi:hypothetical protein
MRREPCLRTLEWKLEEMPREVARPCKTKSVDVLLYSIIRHIHCDEFPTIPKLKRHRHRRLLRLVAICGPKVMCLAIELLRD